MSLIHYSKGSRSQYLERHYWEVGGQEMQAFRAGLNPQQKKDFSECQGESIGERYLEQVRGYKAVFSIDEKSIRQGFDAIYWDVQNQQQVVVEYKGQNSGESNLQKNPGWAIRTCEKIMNREFPYHDVSPYEQSAARMILEHQRAGGVTRYEVIRTYVSPETGKYYTQLEKQTRLEEMGLEQPYPVQTLAVEKERSLHLDRTSSISLM